VKESFLASLGVLGGHGMIPPIYTIDEGRFSYGAVLALVTPTRERDTIISNIKWQKGTERMKRTTRSDHFS